MGHTDNREEVVRRAPHDLEEGSKDTGHEEGGTCHKGTCRTNTADGEGHSRGKGGSADHMAAALQAGTCGVTPHRGGKKELRSPSLELLVRLQVEGGEEVRQDCGGVHAQEAHCAGLKGLDGLRHHW